VEKKKQKQNLINLMMSKTRLRNPLLGLDARLILMNTSTPWSKILKIKAIKEINKMITPTMARS
jgi:hypothetical protein